MTAPRTLTAALFPTGKPKGPAVGEPVTLTWTDFASTFLERREGEKDGPDFVPARFRLEADGHHVRRLGRNVEARTAIALDVEANKKTGEIPPPFSEAVARVRRFRYAAIIYTSHNHTADAPRYRLVLPLGSEIAPGLPAVEVIAEELGFGGVLDKSKIGASSLFYMPSCNPGERDRHSTAILEGDAINGSFLAVVAGVVLAKRRAEEDRVAAEARAEAEKRRQAKIAAGFDPDDSLIERIRTHLDLEQVLLTHGYDKRGNRFLHPNSTSGIPGTDVKNFGGIDRVYSHNATDPLHRDNLPSWCTVAAVDAFDVTAILDYGGDRKKALIELAKRFGLTKAAERKAMAKLLFRLIRYQAAQAEIERTALEEGARLGLSRGEVCRVASWVASQVAVREAA